MLESSRSGPLRGRIRVPGDKSISHRSIMLSSIAQGRSEVTGFLEGEDCLRTMECFRAMGIDIERRGEHVTVLGQGLHGLREPEDVMDAGNSGTTIRLLSGILAGQGFLSVVTGDASLRRRPMDRIADPLRRMGAAVDGRGSGNLAPLVIRGGSLQGITYDLPVPSAQVKSAVLLAGLYAEGNTTVRRDFGSRDHTENMLAALGAEVNRCQDAVSVKAEELFGGSIQVPGDISSAAFFLAAAAAVPGSEVTVQKVGLNPTRTGILDVLTQMGAAVDVDNVHTSGGEPMGDVTVKGGALQGALVSGELIPRLLDEIPVIAVLGAVAEGTTVIADAAELKVKESNRISAMVQELQKLGAKITEKTDGMEIEGPADLSGAVVSSHGDHRIAMSLAVAGLFCDQPVRIEDSRCINTSFPGFHQMLARLTENRR